VALRSRSFPKASADLLRALEPDFDLREDSIVKHDYRSAQAAAMQRLSEAQIISRLRARTGLPLETTSP